MPTVKSYFPPSLSIASLNAKRGLIINGITSGDQIGGSVGAAGTFNNNQFNGLLIGAYQAGGGQGRAYLVFGNMTIGVNGTLELSTINGFNGITFKGSSTSDYLGYAVGPAGDMNCDGIPDVAIGGLGSGGTFAGRTSVIFGGSSVGSSSGGSIVALNLNGVNGYNINGTLPNDNSGAAVGTVSFKVNGNSYSALIIGAYYASPNGRINAGVTYVVKGCLGIGSGGSFSLANLNATTGIKIIGASTGDNSGYSVGSTDIYNDGNQEIVIGSPYAGPNARPTAGITNVVAWRNTGSASIDLSIQNATLFSSLDGLSTDENAGFAVANTGGDFNGDGLKEILTGSPLGSPLGLAQAGLVRLYFGSQLSNVTTFMGATAGEQSGYSVAFVDFNGDGKKDVVIGAPYAFGGTGIVRIYFGNTVAINVTVSLGTLDGMVGVQLTDASAGDNFGWSVCGLGDVNGDGIDDVAVGAPLASPSALRSQAGKVLVYFGDASPQVNTLQLTISDGGVQVLSVASFNITDINHPNSDFIYLISGVNNGYFSVVNNVTPISSFNYTQLLNNQIQFTHSGNHLPPTYSIGVNTTGFAYLPSQPGSVIFLRSVPPALTLNQLTILQGRTTAITLSNFNATSVYPTQDPFNLVLSFLGIQHVQFNSTPTNSAVSSFKLGDVFTGKIIAIHDGSRTAPGYQTVVTDDFGLASTPQSPSINFISAPQLTTNAITVGQGLSVPVGTSIVNATDSSLPIANFNYSISGISNGMFVRYTNLTSPIYSFLQNEILNGTIIRFIPDGSTNAPAYSVLVTNPVYGLSDGPYAANVVFTVRLALLRNQLSILEGQSKPITSAELNATLDGINDSSVVFTISNLLNLQFIYIPNSTPVILVMQGDVMGNNIKAVNTAGTGVPSYQVSLSAGPAFTFAQVATVNYHFAPRLTNKQFAIQQGGTIVLTANNLNSTTLNIGQDPMAFVYYVSGLNIQFTPVGNPNTALTNFTQWNVTQAQILVIHNGLPVDPSCDITLSDGILTNIGAPTAAQITFTYKPVLVTNALPVINQGQMITVTSAQLAATDNSIPAANLVFSISNLQHGAFYSTSDLSTPITSFTQLQVTNGQIVFQQDNTNNAPSYSVLVTDTTNNLSDGPYPMNLAGFHDRPVLTSNQLTINQGGIVTLTLNNLNGTENYISDLSTLIFNATGIHNLQFYSIPNARAVVVFTRWNVTRGDIQAIHDNSITAPGYSVAVGDSVLTSLFQQALISFHNAPILTVNQITIQQGGTIILTVNNLNSTTLNAGQNVLTLVYNLSGLQNIQFTQVGNPSNVVMSFTQYNVTAGNIQATQNGSPLPPSYSVEVSDGVLTNVGAPTAALINFTYKPVLTTNALPVINQGQMITVTSAQLAATDNSVPAANLVFFISNLQHGAFYSTSDLSTPITSFTQLQVTNGQIVFQQDNTNNAPSYSVLVTDTTNNLSDGPYPVSLAGFHDRPVITKNQLAINQGGIVTLTLNNLNGTENYISDLSTLIFNATGIHNLQFYSIPNARAVVVFTRWNVTRGDIQAIHDNSITAPGYSVAVGDSVLTSLFQQALISFHNAPILTVNQLIIQQGVTVILTVNNLNSTTLNAGQNVLTLVYNLSGLQNIQFSQVGNPSNVVTSFTQYNVTAGNIQATQNGSPLSPGYSVEVSDGVLTNVGAPMPAQVIFAYKPVLVTNALPVINQGQMIAVTAAQLAATDNSVPAANLVFFISNLQHGAFYSTSDLSTPITSFTQLQVTNNQIVFQQDGTNNPPSYSVKVTDTTNNLSDGPYPVALAGFHDRAVITSNQLTINQGATITLTLVNLDATENYIADLNTLIFNATGIHNLQFYSIPNARAVVVFTRWNVTRGDIQAIHDNSITAPGYSVAVGDNVLTSFSQQALISFHNAPILTVNQITIQQGGTIILTVNNLNSTTLNAGQNVLTLVYNLSGLQNIQFSQVGNPSNVVTSFTQYNVTAGNIQATQNGSPLSPGYSVEVSDGVLTNVGAPTAALINFTYKPVLTTNALPVINQGQMITVTSAQLAATDNSIPAANLVFSISNLQHGAFYSTSDLSTPITSFTQLQITNGQIVFQQDNTNNAPSYSVLVTDTTNNLSDGPYPVSLAGFHDRPVLTSNQLAINQGGMVTLSLSNLNGAENYISDLNSLIFSATGIHNLQFYSIPNAQIVVVFTRGNVTRGEIRAIHDNSIAAPGYSVAVGDTVLTSLFQQALISFHNAPILTVNRISIGQGQILILTLNQLNATSLNVGQDSEAFVIDISALQNIQFTAVGDLSNVLTRFMLGNITRKEIQIIHNGLPVPPIYAVRLSDGILTNVGGATPAQVTFFYRPQLVNNTIPYLKQGDMLTLTTSIMGASSLSVDPSTLLFSISGLQNGQFVRSSALTTSITSFIQQDILNEVILLIDQNTNSAPSYKVLVTDTTHNLSDGPYPVAVSSFTAGPIITRNQAVINQYALLQMSLQNLNATNPGSIPAISDSSLAYGLSQVVGGGFFTNYTGTLKPLSPNPFSSLNISRGDIFYQQDGGVTAPGWLLTVNNGILSATATPNVQFTIQNFAPTLTVNQITVIEGSNVQISSAVFSATDNGKSPNTPSDNFVFYVNVNPPSRFVYSSNFNTPITQFTQGDVRLGNVYLVPGISVQAPHFTVTVKNQVGLYNVEGSITVPVLYIPISPVAPTVTNNQLTIRRGADVVLSNQNLDASPSITSGVVQDDLSFSVSYSNAVTFKSSCLGGGLQPVTSFLRRNVTNGCIHAEDDGTLTTPSTLITVTDGTATSAPQAMNINFIPYFNPPTIVNHAFSVVQGGVTPMSSSYLTAMSESTSGLYQNPAIQFSVQCTPSGYFQNQGAGSAGTAITQFTQSYLPNVQFFQNGSPNPPICNVTATDNIGSSAVTPISIGFAPNPQPVVQASSGSSYTTTVIGSAIGASITMGLFIFRLATFYCVNKRMQKAAEEKSKLESAVMNELKTNASLGRCGQISQGKINKYYRQIANIITKLSTVKTEDEELVTAQCSLLASMIVEQIREKINGKIGWCAKIYNFICARRELDDTQIGDNAEGIAKAVMEACEKSHRELLLTAEDMAKRAVARNARGSMGTGERKEGVELTGMGNTNASLQRQLYVLVEEQKRINERMRLLEVGRGATAASDSAPPLMISSSAIAAANAGTLSVSTDVAAGPATAAANADTISPAAVVVVDAISRAATAAAPASPSASASAATVVPPTSPTSSESTSLMLDARIRNSQFPSVV